MSRRNLLELSSHDDDGALRVVVESPAGSALKLKYQPDWDIFIPSRALLVGLSYPYDWGFVPSTRASDGDPLDAMVLGPDGSSPGVVWNCDPIAVLRVTQPAKEGPGRVRNDRVIARPRKMQLRHPADDLPDLSPRLREELAYFFTAVVAIDKPGVELLGWGDADEARETIARAELSRHVRTVERPRAARAARG